MEKIACPKDYVMQHGCPKHLTTSRSTNNYYIAIASSHRLSMFNDVNVNKNKKHDHHQKRKVVYQCQNGNYYQQQKMN